MDIIDSKEKKYVHEFILKSKKAFAEKFTRNKVDSIDVSACTPDESYTEAARFAVDGSVETVSPTGKLKTYRYRATVDVKGKECTMAFLEILPLEED